MFRFRCRCRLWIDHSLRRQRAYPISSSLFFFLLGWFHSLLVRLSLFLSSTLTRSVTRTRSLTYTQVHAYTYNSRASSYFLPRPFSMFFSPCPFSHTPFLSLHIALFLSVYIFLPWLLLSFAAVLRCLDISLSLYFSSFSSCVRMPLAYISPFLVSLLSIALSPALLFYRPCSPLFSLFLSSLTSLLPSLRAR